MDSLLWWDGPNLKKNELISHELLESNEDLQDQIEGEMLKSYHIVKGFDLNIFNKFSSFTKLIRVTATCFRFINTLKARIKGDVLVTRKYSITAPELNEANKILIKIV